MKNNHPPTTSSPLWVAFLAPIHAKAVPAMQMIESSGELTLSIILLLVGLLIIIGSFIWQYKIDKDKRKW